MVLVVGFVSIFSASNQACSWLNQELPLASDIVCGVCGQDHKMHLQRVEGVVQKPHCLVFAFCR